MSETARPAEPQAIDLGRLIGLGPTEQDLTAAARFQRRVGMGALGMFMGGLVLWSVFAPLSSAAVVSGVVSPDGSRKTIQHLEGGILADIRAKEGEIVETGQILAVLEDVGARADVATLTAQLERQLARLARLEAERAGSTDVVFDHSRLADPNPELAKLLDDQRRQFVVRTESHDRQMDVLASRKIQLQEQIGGFAAERAGVDEQARLIEEEIGAVAGLVAKGLAEKPRLLELKRRDAELTATSGRLAAEIARANEAIGETELEMLALASDRERRISEELDQVDGERRDLEEQLSKRADILKRTEIRAPVAGRVLNLVYKTSGGVVPPGGAILEIVPNDVDLIIEGRLSPQDVENVTEGMDAKVYFPSLPSRTQPRLHATVRYRSADRVEDERTGQVYYKVWLEVADSEIAKIGDHAQLLPGMPAEAFVLTGEQTILDYILSPLSQSLRRSFREN